MNKELPKYHEIFIPMLQELSNNEIIPFNELRNRIRTKYYGDLPQALLDQRIKSGANLLFNRVGWAKTYLKQALMIQQPKRAMVQITEKGKAVLSVGSITIGELLKDPDFLAHRPTKKIENESNAEPLNESESPEDMLDSGFLAIETRFKTELLEKLKEIDPYYFEKVVLILLKKWGMGILLRHQSQVMGALMALSIKINWVLRKSTSKPNDIMKIRFVKKIFGIL